jgi:hypothetical protein
VVLNIRVMKLHEQKIRKVLMLLENQVEADETLLEVKKLAQKHVLNQKKISELQEQIDALLKKQTALEDKNGLIEDEILNIIGNTKTQVHRFGKIIVDFQVKLYETKTNSAPQYKNIVAHLQQAYNIEKKVIEDLCAQYNNGGKTSSEFVKTLSITKESKQLKEGISNTMRALWSGVKGVFSRLFKPFKNMLDELEVSVAQL